MKPRHLAFLFAGFIAASVFTASATGAERRPLLSVTAPHGDVIELYEGLERRCPMPGGREAMYFVNAGERTGDKIEGCYLIRDEEVLLMFADGDNYRLPLSIFKERGA